MTISALIAISFRTNASNSAGVIGIGLPPSATILSAIVFHLQGGDNLPIEPLDDRLRRLGRREGADPELILGVGQTDSAKVGTSGINGSRFGELTASELTLPSLARLIAFSAGAGNMSMRPAITSVMASGVPRNGTCVTGYPADKRSRSMKR